MWLACFRGTPVSVSSPLPDSRVEERSLKARVGPHQQDQVGLLHTSDAAVQEVVGTEVGSVRGGGECRSHCEGLG